jgi:hypothetical protein
MPARTHAAVTPAVAANADVAKWPDVKATEPGSKKCSTDGDMPQCGTGLRTAQPGHGYESCL